MYSSFVKSYLNLHSHFSMTVISTVNDVAKPGTKPDKKLIIKNNLYFIIV
jgi:hypothetical protein